MLIRLRLRQVQEQKILATIYIDGKELPDGYLSPPDELQSSFEKWQEAYLGLEDVALRLTPKSQKKSFTRSETYNFAESFKHSFDSWLRGEDIKWQKIREKLVSKLAGKQEEDIRIFLDTDENHLILRQFPWQDWEFFDDHRLNAEVILYESIDVSQTIPSSDAVKVLVIVGNNNGIEEGVQEDLKAIKELEQQNRGVFKILKQPSPHELLSELRSQLYQIFIFTGHSGSNENKEIGWIELSKEDHLKMFDLRQALREAITGGLQLCIFNSCDGLGLAKQLTQLQLPVAIVMRDPVPDDVAARFLRVFLENYSGGQSFFKSFREARHQLEAFNLQYPGVCWLPTVCTGILGEQPTWSNLICKETVQGKYIKDKEGENKEKNNGCKPLIFRVGVATVLIGLFLIFHALTRNNEKQSINTGHNLSPELFSFGEINLTPENAFISQPRCLNNLAQKDQGINQFQQKQFDNAVKSFNSFIQKCPFDPEARIYLNNAQAELQGNPLKIAASVPLGGLVGEAQEMLRGVAQVQQKINQQKGINGRPLQVLIANDDTSEDKALLDTAEIVAQDLTKYSPILGVIGHFSSDATLDAGEEYNSEDLVVISPTSTAIREFSDNVFRTPPTDAIAAQDLAQYMTDKNYNKAVVVYDSNSEYSKSISREFGESLKDLNPNNFVKIYECDLSNKTFTAFECVEKFSEQADALALFPPSQLSPEIQSLILKNYNRQFLGSQSLPLLAGDAIYGDKILREVGQEVEGMVIAVPWHYELRNTASVMFLREAQKLWGTQSVNWRTASSYDATMALVQGLRRLGDNSTREGLKQVLSSDGFSAPGATGTIEFDSSGDRQITSRNQNELGILVEVQCYYDDCTYVPLD